MKQKTSAAIEADNLVNGDRGKAYGHPSVDFGRTAGMLQALGFRGPNGNLTAVDIPVIMTCVKLSRMTNNENYNHRDSIVDTIGYMLTLEKCLEVINNE